MRNANPVSTCDVAAFGDNCVDYYENTNRWYMTGNVIDYAVHMSEQGFRTSAVTIVGMDRYGEALLELLTVKDIDASHVHTRFGNTARSDMELVNGERVYRNFDEGVMSTALFSHADVEFVKQHRSAHFGFWGHADGHIAEVHEAGVITSYDFATEKDDPKVGSLLPYIDYAFFSLEEPDDSAKSFLVESKLRGCRIAVGTFGEKGSLAWDGEEIYSGESVAVERLVNTVGAGDAYIAGFMSGVLRGLSIESCMENGSRIAARVVQNFEPY